MWGPLIIAVGYFVVLIGLANYFLHSRIKNIVDFSMAGRSLNWGLVTLALALIPHGSGHTMSLWESSSVLGAAVLWWPIIVGGAFIPIIMFWTGPWMRKLRVETIPEAMGQLYGDNMRSLHCVIQIATWTAIAMAETLATAGAIYGLSGGILSYNPGCIILAFLLMISYIIFGGVLELVWVSVVNVVVMTVGSYLALFFLGGWLVSNAAGWEGVLNTYAQVDQLWKFDLFNFSPEIVFTVIIPVAVLHIAAGGVAQGMYIPLLSARTDEDCRKGFWICSLTNVVTCFPWVIIALVGMSIPAFAAIGPKLIVMEVALKTMPQWVYALLMVSLLTSVLSTGSAIIMGNSTVFINDIIKRVIKPDMSDATRLKLMRPVITLCGLLAAVPALFAPILFPVFLWAFSFGIPLFMIMLFGLVWKTSRTAAWITIIVTYIVNFWWTFATPAWASPPWSLNMYPVTVCSIVLGVVLFAILPGEPGLLRRMKAAEVSSGVNSPAM
ncbi:MAG: sss: transporter, solute:sodium symporter family [Firmicutes bacterium]|nr:sss: transporter, solute:sodium symporter family [Bacillota bacterium]